MTIPEATGLARQVVADPGSVDEGTKRLGAVLLPMAEEVDRWSGVEDRLSRQALGYGISG